MKKITGLKEIPSQSFNIHDIDYGKTIDITLTYRPRTRTWYADFEYESWSAKGIKLVYSENILKQFYKNIHFGFAVISIDGIEPMMINDFSTERIVLYLLSTAEVVQIRADVASGALS